MLRAGLAAAALLVAIGGAPVAEPHATARAVAERCDQLPAPVAAKVAAIRGAAEARDYDRILALIDPDDFTYSFGDDGPDPTPYWRALDMGGDDVLGAIGALLDMPCAVADWGGLNYVWPAAFEIPYADLSEAERSALAALYEGEEIDYYYMDGPVDGFYAGWRLIIDESGRWTYFIAGD